MWYSAILSRFNITALNEMQSKMLDAIQQPNDVVLISPTGSGKTIGYLLPLLQLLDAKNKDVQVLIIVPTRELAIQIEQVFKQMATSFKINSCYGGHNIRIEENNLKHPPAILVGTPGRIAHHVNRGNLSLNNTPFLVLDEFDKSLEFGFKDDMEFIIKNCKSLSKRILTSATVLEEIPEFVGAKGCVELNFSNEQNASKSELTVKYARVTGDDKTEALMLLLGKIDAKATLVFCNHREAVDRISEQLHFYKIDHGSYHGGMEQIERERTLIKFRNGSTNILVTTDLASRGLDIPEIDSVIHYQFPTSEEAMVHRNGRTARMNASGTAYFLLDLNDHLPIFVSDKCEEFILPIEMSRPSPCEWATLYIGAGKKDKINKMDIVGMLIQKGQLNKDDLGKIDVLDNTAYVAIKRDVFQRTLKLVRNEKIKNKRVKIDISM